MVIKMVIKENMNQVHCFLIAALQNNAIVRFLFIFQYFLLFRQIA